MSSLTQNAAAGLKEQFVCAVVDAASSTVLFSTIPVPAHEPGLSFSAQVLSGMVLSRAIRLLYHAMRWTSDKSSSARSHGTFEGRGMNMKRSKSCCPNCRNCNFLFFLGKAATWYTEICLATSLLSTWTRRNSRPLSLSLSFSQFSLSQSFFSL